MRLFKQNKAKENRQHAGFLLLEMV